jgi:hypothetical protein
MKKQSLIRSCAVAGFALAAGLIPSLADAADIRTGNIVVRGVKGEHCTITVTDDNVTLDLEVSTPPGGTKIGSVLQNCNKQAGYTLTLSSVNCETGADGGKMASLVTTPTEYMPYSITFAPDAGTSHATATNLLGAGCSGNSNVLARDVTNERVDGQRSNVFAVFNAVASLSADSYTDTLTITMTVK